MVCVVIVRLTGIYQLVGWLQPVMVCVVNVRLTGIYQLPVILLSHSPDDCQQHKNWTIRILV